jgi:outer membrane lipopolysaccharide assembly protein LptE/RlpB
MSNLVAYARLASFILTLTLTSSCGYHTAGHSVQMPGLRTIAVPTFANETQAYRVEQVLTNAVVRELNTRTKYRVITGGDADARLRGRVLVVNASPLTYDSQTGRASSILVTVNVDVDLIDRSGKVLYHNPNYLFRDEYQVSREITSFFEEESPAMARMARDFASTLVSDMVEGF